jgi:hypothetical protein
MAVVAEWAAEPVWVIDLRIQPIRIVQRGGRDRLEVCCGCGAVGIAVGPPLVEGAIGVVAILRAKGVGLEIWIQLFGAEVVGIFSLGNQWKKNEDAGEQESHMSPPDFSASLRFSIKRDQGLGVSAFFVRSHWEQRGFYPLFPMPSVLVAPLSLRARSVRSKHALQEARQRRATGCSSDGNL